MQPAPVSSENIRTMNKKNEEFLIVAASCRAMVRSVSQAGYRCRGIDLFADWDAQQICEVQQVSSFEAAVRAATNLPDRLRTLIGAGVENAVAGREDPFCGRPVYAPLGQTLVNLSDPFFVAGELQAANFPTLPISRHCPATGAWMEKPIHAGGGQGVRRIDSAAFSAIPKPDAKQVYYQQYVPGVVCGASFVAAQGTCELMGVCRQIPSTSTTHPFLYSGSYGPFALNPEIERQVCGMARVLADACNLQGWFGIDFIEREGEAWLLELNPRYTASMEILERISKQSLFDYHLNAFEPLSPIGFSLPRAKALLGKQYVYWESEDPVVVQTDAHRQLVQLGKSAERFVTDIPWPGTAIETAMPICTVWATAGTEAAVLEELGLARQAVLKLFRQKKTAKK